MCLFQSDVSGKHGSLPGDLEKKRRFYLVIMTRVTCDLKKTDKIELIIMKKVEEIIYLIHGCLGRPYIKLDKQWKRI